MPESQKGKMVDESSVLGLCQETLREGNRPLALGIWNFLECRNLLLNILLSCQVLQKDGFCDDSISLLAIYRYRHKYAELRSVQIESIVELSDSFERCVSDISTRKTLDEHSFLEMMEILTLDCRFSLVNIFRFTSFPYQEKRHIVWRTTVHALELATLSYSGAHIEPFDKQYLGSHLDTFQITVPFLVEPSLNIARPEMISMGRRSLRCLDNFLGGKKVWVFSRFWRFWGSSHERLYLVTEVDTFADIWGPLWKECLIGKPERVTRYKVGYGYIVPWNWDQINLKPGEVCCHWFAESDLPKNASFDKMKTFNGTETLVIGAPYVRPNRDCRCPNQMIKQRLKESGLIHPLATYEACRYVEGKTMEIAVGIPAKGFTGKYGRTWKRRDDHHLRLAFLESWEHPELNCLDPAELEHKYGLEISLSTNNGRKIPLVRRLGSPSMLEYLRPYSLLEADCKTKYIDAVRNKDLKAFRRLWQSNP